MNNTTGTEKHIMVSVDQSSSAMRAVLYVADMLGGLEGFRITLFSLISIPSGDYFGSDVERSGWIEKERKDTDELLGRMREFCVQAGFPEDKVDVRSEARHCSSVAVCLIDEVRELGACTLVVGRRGVSMREEFLFGSTSSQVAHSAQNCAVWIVE